MLNTIASLLARFQFGRVGVAVAIASTLVVAPLLAFSETTLKSILDRWLSQCTVVVDINQGGAEAPIVRLYNFGDMPSSLPLTFAAGKGLIERVSLLNHVEQETTLTEPNVLVHPLANQRCPGDLCPDTGEASEKLTVRIKPVSSNYILQFRVIYKDNKGGDLKVYIKPLLDEIIVCRVETTTFSNYFARQSRGIQVVLLFFGVIIFSLLLLFLRKRTGAQS